MLYLASQSPRRRALLKQIGIDFIAQPADIDEAPIAGESAENYVKRMSISKARTVQQQHTASPVLGSDTAVVLDGQILGKPQDKEDAIQMLMMLSNNTHRVLTGVALLQGNDIHYVLSDSQVSFRQLTQQEAIDYWHTGEPCDKAGAYAIQGYGAVFVKYIQGSYSGIMGLPVYETALLVKHVT